MEEVQAAIDARKPDFAAFVEPQKEKADIVVLSYLGENLAWGATGKKGVDLWYDEIKLTPGGKGEISGFTKGTGHYTQVVWKRTTELGCAVNGRLLVCQYGVG